MKAPRLVQVDITTLDILAAASAWKQSLGFVFTPDANDAVMGLPGIELRLKTALDGDTDRLAGLVFEVEDLDAAISRLAGMGAATEAEEPAAAGAPCIDIDPGSAFGVRLRLRSAPPGLGN